MGSFGAGLIAVFCAFGMGAQSGFAACAPDLVELRGPNGAQQFHIELADDVDEQAQGLMFREKLSKSAGMLFAFGQPKHAQFWMKNTLIPLDMIFVDVTGVVTHVHSNAVPHDETVIDGGEGVAFVLEINGGLAARMGIAAGSQMRHPLIEKSKAIWGCDAP